MSELTREVKFIPGYAKWSNNPSQNYGFGAVHILFILKGDKGAVSFNLFTSFYPKAAHDHWKATGYQPQQNIHYLGSLDYHSKEPIYEWQQPTKCEHTGTGTCYCDGTSLVDDLIEDFINQGDSVIWTKLEEWYHNMEPKNV